MRHRIRWVIVLGALGACASGQLPMEQLTQVQTKMRAAEAKHARASRPAGYYLRYADQNVEDAKFFARRGDTLQAGNKLSRAAADAEVAGALAELDAANQMLQKASQP